MVLSVLNWLGLKGSILSVALLAVASWGALQWVGKTRALSDIQEMQAEAAVDKAFAQFHYNKLVIDQNEIAKRYDKRLDAIEKDKKQLLADLRVSRVKLREHYYCPAPGQPSASGLSPDEAARLREKDAAENVADAARADEWIRSLQAIIQKYSARPSGKPVR